MNAAGGQLQVAGEGEGPAEWIGLIGLGLVGKALSGRLFKAGFGVVGYDVDDTQMASLEGRRFKGCRTAAEVAGQARRIVLSLPDSGVVEQVVDSIKGAWRPGGLVIDTTTADPPRTVTLGRSLQERGVEFVDATILGSSQQVADGEAVVMLGGDAEVCRDILETFARRIFPMGPCGKGAEAKLVVNLVLGLQRLVLAEGLLLGQQAGMDAGGLLEVLKSGAAYARVMDTKGEKMAAGDFEPQARLAQHLKDVDLILQLGARTQTPLPLSGLHAQILRAGVAQGLGGLDNAAVIEVLRSMAGKGRDTNTGKDRI